jgi:hypothetical protein
MAGEKAKLDNNFIPVQLGVDSAGNIRMLKVDKISDSIITIPFEHHELHEGDSFVVCDVQSVDTTTLKWLITTPDSLKYCHALFDIQCTGEVSILVTEGADRTGVTALTAINRRRVGTPTVATLSVKRTTSAGTTDGAITIESKRVGATGSGSKTISAGGSRGNNEYILKPNTKYVVAITTYAAVYVSMCLDWYEHTDTN